MHFVRCIAVNKSQVLDFSSCHLCLKLAVAIIGNCHGDFAHRTVNGHVFLVRSLLLHFISVGSGLIIADITEDDLSVAIVLHRLYYLTI